MAEDADEEEQHRATGGQLRHRRGGRAGRALGRTEHHGVADAGREVGLVQVVDRLLQRRPQAFELRADLDAFHGQVPADGLGEVADLLRGQLDLLAQRLALLLGQLHRGVRRVARQLPGVLDELLRDLVGELLGVLGGVRRDGDRDDVAIRHRRRDLLLQVGAGRVPLQLRGGAVEHDRAGRDLGLGEQLVRLARSLQQDAGRGLVPGREEDGGAGAHRRSEDGEGDQQPPAPAENLPDQAQAHRVVSHRRDLHSWGEYAERLQ